MLERIGKLGEFFGQGKSEHPLADPKELRRIFAELPKDNAYKALDEIAGWLESAHGADDLHGVRLFDIVRQLDEAAQWHVLRLSREYLHSRHLSKQDEKRLWSVVSSFWARAAAGYERCIAQLAQKEKGAEALKSQLPLLCARLVACLGAVLKWELFRYGPCSDALWLRLGLAYSTADQAGVATKPVQLYPRTSGMTSPEQEYVQVLALHTSSADSLLPAEIELAERLVAYFRGGFVFSAASSAESVYWVDVARALPPARLARVPRQVVPTLRFFQPGRAHDQAAQLATELERGGALPPDLNLGNQYHPRAVLPVLRHLATYWSPVPPQRKHARHPVKHRMSVVAGLPNAIAVLSEPAEEAARLPQESWVVENVSRGGFGTVAMGPPGEWLKVGTLLAMQPEGGENWLLGVVRRYHRSSENEARVGILALARQASAVTLRPRGSTSYGAAAAVRGVWIQNGEDGDEMRVVVPLATFDLRETVEFEHQGRRQILTPVALAEQTADYEIARYRFPA